MGFVPLSGYTNVRSVGRHSWMVVEERALTRVFRSP